MAGAVFAQRGRSEFRHVLGEDVARRDAFYQQRADVADHGGDPVAFFQSVAGADGNRFLAKAGVEAADNFILSEETDHALFELAIELHVIVEGEMMGAAERRSCAFARCLRRGWCDARLPLNSNTSLGRGASACWRDRKSVV